MGATAPDLDQSGTATRPDPGADPRARILAAGRRLIVTKAADFTTQDVIGEAGVALQTFYRYFGSKDQLLLALIGDLISEHCALLVESARRLTDPLARLEMYVRTTLTPLRDPDRITAAQFITAEHWRLHQTCPAEVWAATQPMSDLLRAELEAGSSAGTLAPRNPERDAWLMTKTLIGAYHHYAFQPNDPAMATLDDDVWFFCLAAVGGVTPRPRAH
ncbi:MAG: TetR/AcrR family transcriptional regulator [Acidimicrobiales bacterium]